MDDWNDALPAALHGHPAEWNYTVMALTPDQGLLPNSAHVEQRKRVRLVWRARASSGPSRVNCGLLHT